MVVPELVVPGTVHYLIATTNPIRTMLGTAAKLVATGTLLAAAVVVVVVQVVSSFKSVRISMHATQTEHG